MNITTRIATPGDGKLVSQWYDERGFVDPQPTIPPLGVVGFLDGIPSATIWAHEFVGSPLAMVDWMVTRPGMKAREARAVLHAVWEGLELQLRARGRKNILIQFNSKALACEAEKLGFAVCNSGVINMGKKLS